MKVKTFILFSIFVVVFGVLLLNSVSSTFASGNESHSISKIYGPSANLTGWINLSLVDEPSDSVVKSFFNGDTTRTLSLKEFLAGSPSYTYTCSPLDCASGYSASNGQTSKVMTLGSNESKNFGLKITGHVVKIDSAKLNIQSDASASCQSQLKTDLFSEGIFDFANNKSHATLSCGETKDYGCFDSLGGEGTSEFNLVSSETYCQRIKLSSNPGFTLGTWIKKSGGGDSNLYMDVRDLNNDVKDTCQLQGVTSASGQDYNCDVDYLVLEPAEHFVCVYASGGDESGAYKVRGYDASGDNACGFNGVPPRQETAAYEISAEGRQFDAFGTLSVANNLPGEVDSFSDKIQSYLIKKYGLNEGTIDCSSAEGCVVPISLNSSVSQSVTLGSLELVYTTTSGQKTENNFYDISKSPYLITSSPTFQRLFIEKSGFSVPSSFKNYTLNLRLGPDNLISDKIEVKDIPIIRTLSPTSTASAVPTIFNVNVDVPKKTSVVSYFWDFGDDSVPRVTSVENVSHTFNDTGYYDVSVTVTDTRGLSSSKVFNVSVTSPRVWVNTTLNEVSGNLKNIKEYIGVQSLSVQKSLKDVLGIDEVSSEITRLEREYSRLGENDTEEYEALVGNLLNIYVPERIILSGDSSFPLLPESSSIDLDSVKNVLGGNYDERDSNVYQDAILLWQYNNLDANLVKKEFSAESDSKRESLVNVFELTLDEKNSISDEYYLFVPKLEGIQFDKPSQEKDGFVYVKLNGISKVSFHTTEDISVTEFPAFISPSISKLSVGGRGVVLGDSSISKKSIFVASILLLLLLAIGVYIFLQQWYKKKYEKHLFPNRNDLYNLVNYIDNAKKKGLNHGEISDKLKKSKWTHEQIRYGIKKYEGERTGMFELPLPGLVKKMERGDSEPEHKKGPEHRKK